MALTLTPSQIAQYQEQGFLLTKASEHVKGKWMPYDEINVNGQRQLMRTEKFVDYHPQFDAFLRGEGLINVLNQLSGASMLLFKDKINYKSAHDNGVAARLDAPAYDHIGEVEQVTVNLAVDTATSENGCLEVVPKPSHKMNVTFSQGGKIHADWEAAHDWVSVPMEVGDILFFRSHLAQRSGLNKTEKLRAMIYATFASEADRIDLRGKYYEHRKATFPSDHALC